MVCNLCNSFKRLLPIQSLDEPYFPPQAAVDLIKSDLSFAQVEHAARSCYCCKIMVDGCLKTLENHNLHREEVSTLSLHLCYHAYIDEEKDLQKLISVKFKDGSTFDIHFFVPEDAFYPEKWDDVCCSHRTTTNTGSDAAFEKIQTWLAECFEEGEHELCDHSAKTLLPTRVIDVGLHDGVIKLVETGGKVDQYVCLSHCWGSTQIITTTKATLDDRKKEINPQSLSKTFNDAIEMTKKLQIKYIWIDSLCIVQDDQRDWEIESAKMASIYQNAYLTIAATRSSSGNGGLFTSTPECEISGTTPSGDEFVVVFRKQIEHIFTGGRDYSTTCPLLSRGWVFQERLLSPRAVHFGPDEVFFECKSDSQCECGEILGFEVPLPQPKISHADALKDTKNKYYLSRIWRATVMQYTSLDLTYAKDCFPALSGLARQMAAVRESKYICGLWEDSLQDDLLWLSPGASVEKKVDEYVAPSWSWACINRNIYYKDAPLFWYEGEADEKREVDTHYTRVKSWQCIPAGLDEFGQLKEARICLSGICIQGLLRYGVREETPPPLNPSRRGKEPFIYYVLLEGESILEIHPDYMLKRDGPGYIPQNTPVLCLRMSLCSEGSKRVLVSLVLRPAEGTHDTYRRIGLLRIILDQEDGAQVADQLFSSVANETSVVII